MSHPPIPLPHQLPDGLLPFTPAAIGAVNHGAVQHIEFSGPTYHIAVCLNGTTEWVFIQLRPDHTVLDLFCDCADCAQTGYCIHMAIGLLAIFNKTDLPLHVRFAKSPLYVLCEEYYSRAQIQKKTDLFTVGPIECRGQTEQLEQYVLKTEEQNEENSIKFSNLTEDELRQYDQGTISEHLAFELSPLTDLCKYLFCQIENQDHLFKFEPVQGVPTEVTILLKDLSCHCVLPSNLPRFLDAIHQCSSNLVIEHFGGKTIEGIALDKTETLFSLILSGVERDLSAATQIGMSDWFFIENVGFIQKLRPKTLPLTELPLLLEDLAHALPLQSMQYQATFDASQILTIIPFLKTPSDLVHAKAFGTFVYEKTLTRIEPSFVPFQGLSIPPEELPDFIESHKEFLSTLPGLSVHSAPRNKELTYSIDPSGALICTQKTSKTQACSTFQFDNWVYVPEQGFFKDQAVPSILIDTPIPPHRVSAYISTHRSLFEQIPNFFAPVNPIKEAALSIQFHKNQIDGIPQYVWVNPADGEKALLYGDFGYIEGTGFFPLPKESHEQPLEFSIFLQDKEAWEAFFLDRLPLLQKSCSCTIDACLLPPKDLQLICHNAEIQAGIEGGKIPNQFDVSFYYQSEKGRVTAHELMLLSAKVQRFVPTKAGLLDTTDLRFAWLSAIKTEQHNRPSRLRSQDFLKIAAFERIHFDDSTSTTIQETLHRLIYAIPSTEANLARLHSSLRPYQTDGIRWLWNLYLCGLSALLCDDMGVGKTHQALGLIASVSSHLETTTPRPLFLIICPTSLVSHWKEKANALLPSLRTCLYAGPDRSQALDFPYDLLITTYGIWRNDAAILSKLHFEVAVFDELQLAKNHISQIWSALTKVSSSMRIGLTGTPIENRLRELKALFDIILPGYFPKENLFKNQASFNHKSIVSAYAKPFILRRRKKDVLQDLPIKTEELVEVELTPDQRELYKKVAARETSAILSLLENSPDSLPYMHIFALLSALKQICNHPATYVKDIENYESYTSGKWEAFQELVEEALNSGQKIVVFSHSLPMLDIIGLYLTKQGIHYAQIRGSTKNRKEQLDRFQHTTKCKVFLASLMAAGLGIDLTAASVVIHYDRWWNAARENQATDRVHRLGQQRGVMVFKLMTSKTIEERIDTIISSKSSLLQTVLSYDDHRIIKQLSKQELIDLLRGIEDV